MSQYSHEIVLFVGGSQHGRKHCIPNGLNHYKFLLHDRFEWNDEPVTEWQLAVREEVYTRRLFRCTPEGFLHVLFAPIEMGSAEAFRLLKPTRANLSEPQRVFLKKSAPMIRLLEDSLNGFRDYLDGVLMRMDLRTNSFNE